MLSADFYLNEIGLNFRPTYQPKKVPMPYIHGNEDGPIIVTEDWYVEAQKEWIANVKDDVKEFRLELMELLMKRDRCNYQLGLINPLSKKGIKKRLKLMEEIEDINAQIQMYKKMSGWTSEKLHQGFWFARAIRFMKDRWKEAKKKIEKFYDKHEKVINKFAAIALPIVIGGIVNKIAGVFS